MVTVLIECIVLNDEDQILQFKKKIAHILENLRQNKNERIIIKIYKFIKIQLLKTLT